MKRGRPELSRQRLLSWLHGHRLALKTAISHMLATPVSSLLTILAIALALALPSAILLTVDAISGSLGNSDGRQLSAFMKLNVDGKDLHLIAAELEKNPKISHVETISRTESLEKFRNSSGMADILKLLPENPLPAVLIIHPDDQVDSLEALQRLAELVEQSDKVESVALDQEWMATLFSTLQAIQRFSLAMSLLFALLVALVIYNGLRIELLQHRNEIEVIKLVGGSDHYIQRPFHYHAVLLGGLGALLAALVIAIVFSGLQPYFDKLSTLYGAEIKLRITAGYIVTLVLLGIILSLLSARISMGFLLKKVQP